MASHTVSAVAVTRPGPRRNAHCWSKLPQDLLRLIFERLGFTDFQRAKTVCSPWLFASKISQPNNEIPWMILFPKDNNYGLLFNPEEKDKVYKTQYLGNDFAKSLCVATYRSWLLMLDPQCTEVNIVELSPFNLYILDLLTRERINLPTFQSDLGLISPVLWIDEKTKDYLVIRMHDDENAVFVKKGDNSWKQIPELLYDCFDMLYKDHKLYCLNYHKLKIFDFSGQVPLQVFKISVRGCVHIATGLHMRLPDIPHDLQVVKRKNNMVVTVRGDVLIVRSLRPFMSKIWNFEIYKMDSSKKTKWEKIISLGDESILLDLGVTVLAKDGLEGITRNSIYFNGNGFEDKYDQNEIFIYNLDTNKIEQPQQFVYSSIPLSNARWFFPSFKRDIGND